MGNPQGKYWETMTGKKGEENAKKDTAGRTGSCFRKTFLFCIEIRKEGTGKEVRIRQGRKLEGKHSLTRRETKSGRVKSERRRKVGEGNEATVQGVGGAS